MTDQTPATPVATDEAATADDIGLQRAAAIVAAAATDPVGLASQFLEWQSAVKGTHALLHMIVKQLAGLNTPIIVPQRDLAMIDPDEELLVQPLPDGDFRVVVRTKNREERRAEQKAHRA